MQSGAAVDDATHPHFPRAEHAQHRRDDAGRRTQLSRRSSMRTVVGTKPKRSGTALAVVVGLAVAGATGMAAASRGGHGVFARQRLTPPVATSPARGRAMLLAWKHHGNLEGSLDVYARALTAASSFEVLVDGVKIGDFTTNAAGGGHAHFRSHPRGSALVLGVDPRGKRLVIRDTEGADVLAGDWPPDGNGAGKVACCIPDSAMGAFGHDRHGRSGGEHGRHGHHGDDDRDCRMKTVDECAQVGGTSAGGSCLPDPCEETAPAPDGTVCCIPEDGDDDGAECEHRSPAACAAEGGTMVSATGCEPNPCAPTPASGPATVVCCLPDGGSAECEHRTSADCVAQGGVDKGPGSCFPDPCGTPGGQGGDGDGDGGHRGPGRGGSNH
jgi:hypothetical protein